MESSFIRWRSSPSAVPDSSVSPDISPVVASLPALEEGGLGTDSSPGSPLKSAPQSSLHVYPHFSYRGKADSLSLSALVNIIMLLVGLGSCRPL